MGQLPEWHLGSCFQSRACIESTAPVWARFFFPHSVLEITLYREALFSHSSVLSLHLQDEVEYSSGNDGGKGRGFSGQPKYRGRETCVQTPTSMPISQPSFPGGRVAVHVRCFVLDVCLGCLTFVPILSAPSPAPTSLPCRVIRREKLRATIKPSRL